MDAKEFIFQVQRLKPTKKELQDLRLSEKFIEEHLASYDFIQKGDCRYGNPLLDLVYNYDFSTFQVGGLRFDIEPYEDRDNFTIGQFDSDLVMQSKKSEEIIVIDFHQPGHIIFHCAASGSLFLSCILKCLRFNNLPENQKILEDPCKTAQDIAIEAGGNKYLPFYKVILACVI